MNYPIEINFFGRLILRTRQYQISEFDAYRQEIKTERAISISIS